MSMTQFYNAFHSPIGAHSSFTLGCLGAKGGLKVEGSQPADQNIYVGLETKRGGVFEALPFFGGAEDAASMYDHANKNKKSEKLLIPFNPKKIKRDYNLGSDVFKAGDLTFSVYSLVDSAPDPSKATTAKQKMAYCPAVLAELTINNTKGKKDRKAFFGFQDSFDGDSMRWLQSPNMTGVVKGQSVAILTDDTSVTSSQAFSIERILTNTVEENYKEGLGATGTNLFTVKAGQKKTVPFVICFYRGGVVTTGIETSYWYTKFFKNIEEVGSYSLKNFKSIKKACMQADKLLASKTLNESQRFQMVHAIRSYYGSTQLLNDKGKPIWIVNEGQYRMMNTFDLTVDQLFYEMKLNPWTVKNELDLFISRYSYTDKLHFKGGKNVYQGGLSFTHDMGQKNHFTRPGYSSYERAALTGCFSYMTHEQLVNFILCATVYYKQSQDHAWMKKTMSIMKKCLKSMLNRDNPNAKDRNGIMALDSSRTHEGAEITTYDSLDVSLGQARNNAYIAVKGWASYVAMADLFSLKGLSKEANVAKAQAEKAAKTIASYLNTKGFIPAVMGEDCDARIIPAIEGLVFPKVLGLKDALKVNGDYGCLIQALTTHFNSVFKKNVCIYKDNGWKLSNTADNSWLSKIYLCQYVARNVLGIKNKATGISADKAHEKWLLNEENLYWAWSDQMTSGIAMGSKYYPRGVTNILWLDEK